jgi:hypothetical protein
MKKNVTKRQKKVCVFGFLVKKELHNTVLQGSRGEEEQHSFAVVGAFRPFFASLKVFCQKDVEEENFLPKEENATTEKGS